MLIVIPKHYSDDPLVRLHLMDQGTSSILHTFNSRDDYSFLHSIYLLLGKMTIFWRSCELHLPVFPYSPINTCALTLVPGYSLFTAVSVERRDLIRTTIGLNISCKHKKPNKSFEKTKKSQVFILQRTRVFSFLVVTRKLIMIQMQ